jgi:hypothetical protein
MTVWKVAAILIMLVSTTTVDAIRKCLFIVQAIPLLIATRLPLIAAAAGGALLLIPSNLLPIV